MRDVSLHLGDEARLEARAVGLDEAEPEAEERIGEAVRGPLAVAGRRPKGQVPPHQAEVEKAGERPGERRGRLAQPSRDLGEAVAARADERQDRVGLRDLAQVVEQEAGRLVVEDAEWREDQGSHGSMKLTGIRRELPVARHAAPHREGLDRPRPVTQAEGRARPARPQGPDPEHLGRAAEQGRRSVENQAVHHALRGSGEHEVDTGRDFLVDALLEEARDLAPGRDQRGELVQGEDHARARFPPPPPEERVPVRVAHVGEAGKEAGDLARQGSALERRFDGRPRRSTPTGSRQGLLQQPGLPAAAAPVENGEGPLPA